MDLLVETSPIAVHHTSLMGHRRASAGVPKPSATIVEVPSSLLPRTQIHSSTRSRTHEHARVHACACVNARRGARTPASTHARTHARSLARTHARTHIVEVGALRYHMNSMYGPRPLAVAYRTTTTLEVGTVNAQLTVAQLLYLAKWASYFAHHLQHTDDKAEPSQTRGSMVHANDYIGVGAVRIVLQMNERNMIDVSMSRGVQYSTDSLISSLNHASSLLKCMDISVELLHLMPPPSDVPQHRSLPLPPATWLELACLRCAMSLHSTTKFV